MTSHDLHQDRFSGGSDFLLLLLATIKRPSRMARRISGRPMNGTPDGGGLTVVVLVVGRRTTATCNVTCGMTEGS
jgi:hypothetical protein